MAELDGAGNVVSRFVYTSKGNVPDYMGKLGNLTEEQQNSGEKLEESSRFHGACPDSFDFVYATLRIDSVEGFRPDLQYCIVREHFCR